VLSALENALQLTRYVNYMQFICWDLSTLTFDRLISEACY